MDPIKKTVYCLLLIERQKLCSNSKHKIYKIVKHANKDKKFFLYIVVSYQWEYQYSSLILKQKKTNNTNFV